MTEYLFQLPESESGTLQSQIQQMIVNSILEGHIATSRPLPSSRKLAKQLKVARNTVMHAYQKLSDDGFLIAKDRSGYYINPDILKGRTTPTTRTENKQSKIDWQNKIVSSPLSFRQNQKTDNWHQYPYPFICGQYDESLFPIADWRTCAKDAITVSAIHTWAKDHVDQDNSILIDQIHKKILPRRGVWANPEEILVTVGAQQGIYLAAQLLLTAGKIVGFESPGYVDAENTFQLFTDKTRPLNVDQQGLIPDEQFAQCDCVYTTPSHHYPSTVTMPKSRRLELLEQAQKHNIIIVEDDYESEFNYIGEPTPALKSLDNDGRVIYVGSLSKTLAPGIRLGYMVADKAFIDQARALRRLILRHPPSNNQYIIARFLQMGYHDSLIKKLSETLQQRWSILGDLLEKHLPGNKRPTFGGSAFWVECPNQIDTTKLAQAARTAGILFEPGEVFFHREPKPKNFLRLGFSSIPTDKITTGVEQLVKVIEAHS